MRSAPLITTALLLATAAMASITAKQQQQQQPRGASFTRTALDDYVAAPDPQFSYTAFDPSTRVVTAEYTITYYNMTSLAWLNASQVDRPIWTHLVAIIVPAACVADNSSSSAPASCIASAPFLWITGGDNRIPKNVSDDEDLFVGTSIAVATHAPAIVVKQVPNEPLEFAADPLGKGRRLSPDAMLGMSWWHFVNYPTDPEWILLLPMTKAAIKAMDMVQAVLPSLISADRLVPSESVADVASQFIVSGASKRGWTAWLVAAAVPSRVKAVVPLVLDALQLRDFVHRQYQFYGGFTFALQPMWEYNFTANIDKPSMALMLSIMDPYYYLDRMTMPKLAVNAVGDEFLMPDDQRHWGHDAVGEMKFLMVKNTDHTLATGIGEVIASVSAFSNMELRNFTRPTVDWSIDNVTGDITVTTSVPPLSVDVVVGDSAGGVSTGKRDFRWAAMHVDPCVVKFWSACLRLVLWETTQTGLKTVSPTQFVASMPTPASGWRGFFIEVRFPVPADALPPGAPAETMLFTSPTSVIPLTRPFPDCHGEGCRGEMM